MNNIESKPKDLETVKGWLAIARENNNRLAIQIIENLFPSLCESDDEKVRMELLDYLKSFIPHHDIDLVKKSKVWIAWLEKQAKKEPVEQDTEINDLWVYIREWVDKFGRLPKDEDELTCCIDYVMKRQKSIEWSKEDELMIQDAIHWIQEFQKSDRCKDENDMQNSVTCENWLKSLKPNNWKPNEEQMQALFEAKLASTKNREYFLGLLYEDLKKL